MSVERMEVEEGCPPVPPSWFEFLLDKGLLKRHLSTESPDPSAATLLSNFVLNLERSAVESESGPLPPDLPPESEGAIILSLRQKKTRGLRLLALRTAAFLNWDLEALALMHISTQYAFMKTVLQAAQPGSDDNADRNLSKEFLRVLFHRWVLRTFQCHNSFTKPTRYGQQADQILALENVWKELNDEESVNYLKSCLTKQDFLSATKIIVPNAQTFDVEIEPAWATGDKIEKSAFESMIHIDLGLFFLHRGNTANAVVHLQQQRIPLQGFPYFKISRNKLEGCLRSVGLLSTFDQGIEDSKIVPKSLDHNRTLEQSLSLRKGFNPKLKKLLNVKLEPPKKTERLKAEQKDNEAGAFIIPGEEKLASFPFEKLLLETTNIKEIEECLKNLHSVQSQNSAPRPSSTLFTGWELPIPVQHAVKNLTGDGPLFQDYIYALIAKSRQLLACKEYSESRRMLEHATTKLQQKLQLRFPGGLSPYVINLGKLVTMLNWEVLLLDITQFLSEYPNGIQSKDVPDLKTRCRECLESLQDPKTELNPRSEIVENILVAFINLGEYGCVANFEKMQNQRWPFVEFIALLARVCHDLFMERKDSSSSYRELWSAVLPIFSNSVGGTGSGSTKKQINSISNKPSMLSSRSSLSWIIDRSCSQQLISVWVSLLARLHNHILDDVGVQIHADFLHIWPNILDDITAPTVIVELKSSRVSGSSKLNSKQIRDFLFNLLERAIKITRGREMVLWLRGLGDVHLAAGAPAAGMKCYVEYLAVCTDFFENSNSPHWNDSKLFKRMIKCCELLGCFTQAVVLCQFLSPEVDYSVAFGMAQEKSTNDCSDALYGFVWDLTILEFLINLHTKRNENSKRQQAIKIMGLLELNSNNNEEIQREARCLRRSQFMRTLAKHYIFI